MELPFTTTYAHLQEKINLIDPLQYARSRNYINGAVTYLSPYISRGVISTKNILDHVLTQGYKISEIAPFVKELCWRDYFQRVAQVKEVNYPIKQEQQVISNYEIPSHVINASTGITAIDDAIQLLYTSGYMHNHCRMYTASLVCNIAQSHWRHPAQWMYYHLLDGDWASNFCSWQWVAGANSNKKYYTNQENINKYTCTNQENTFLDQPYEALETLPIPDALRITEKFNPELVLPTGNQVQLDVTLPTFVYNYYNLDPKWHDEQPANRVLLIEPEFFASYPISKKCFDFMIALSRNIAGIQMFVGSFQSLSATLDKAKIYYKEHPLNKNYSGVEEPRDWISSNVIGYYPSFFSYWKKIEKHMK